MVIIMKFKLYSSLAKVFPQNVSAHYEGALRLSALEGETVSFQAVYKKSGKNLTEWALLRVNAPAGVSIGARRVRCVPGNIPPHYKIDKWYISTETGLYPDVLEPLTETSQPGVYRLPILSGIWQSCWIDVCVADSADAGSYDISVCLERQSGEIIAQDKITVDVIPEKLPPLDICNTRWFHVDCLAEYYNIEVFSDRHWEIIENFAAYAVEHGVNTLLTPIHTPPLDTDVGGERITVQLIDISTDDSDLENAKFAFDFEKFERWVSMCKRIGVDFYEMAHLFTQWGAKHAPKIMGTKKGEYTRLFGWETDAVGKGYANYLRQMLPALTAKLSELEIADKTIFHVSDEPGKEHLEAYRAARNLVRPLLRGYKVVDALTNYDFYKQGIVDVPIPAVDHIEPFLEGNVPDLWCYYCCAQSYKVPNHFVMQPSYRSRILGVLLYKFEIKGFLHWGYNFYNSQYSMYPIDPYITTDADGAFPSGDSFVVYPGRDGKPLASLRLLVIREAFNDYRALKLLESRIGREKVIELIEEGQSKPLTFSKFPQSESYVSELREKVNKALSG